jgi:hypothetical protein
VGRPEEAFRRGYEHAAIETFHAVSRFLEPAAREILRTWSTKTSMALSAATHGVESGRAAYAHHAHSIDRWDDATGSNLYELLAGVNDLLLARATFAAAVKRWPGAKITLSNGARIIEKTWPADD